MLKSIYLTDFRKNHKRHYIVVLGKFPSRTLFEFWTFFRFVVYSTLSDNKCYIRENVTAAEYYFYLLFLPRRDRIILGC